MLWHSSILIAICSLFLGCNTGEPARSATRGFSTSRDVQMFSGDCDKLRASDGFRQNVWVRFNRGSHGAICMDLDHQLYLVVNTEIPIRSLDRLSEQFKKLRVSVADLSNRLDPDAFILNESTEDRIHGIFRIPADPEESFVAELFNELMGLNLKAHDIWFQWD